MAFAKEESDRLNRKVISNVTLKTGPGGFKEYQKFDIAWFLENLISHEVENCILLLDEMYQLADSRNAPTKLNKLFSYFIVQCRKRDVDMYFCTHHIDHVDLRLRRAVEVRGACRTTIEKPCKKCKCHKCGGAGIYGENKEPCPECQGKCGTGRLPNGEVCDRCWGFGSILFVL